MPPIAVSLKAQRTNNPIRAIVDNLKPPAAHPKPLLNLALGDPTAHGLDCPEVLTSAVQEALASHVANGYLQSTGMPAARRAIAHFSSLPLHPVSENDVIIASGCSGALDLCISALLDTGDNLLVPKPGFPLYQVITESLGAHCRHYPLLPEKNWEADVPALEALIDARTRALLINNPSNPTGSTFSAAHLRALAAVARRHNLPIIADEIYGGLVYDGVFEAMHVHAAGARAGVDGGEAEEEEAVVPVICISGIAKEFCVPGWRLGWTICYDGGTGRLDKVKAGMRSLSQLIVGANSLIQAALPRLLSPPIGSSDATSLVAWKDKLLTLLRCNAALVAEACQTVPELSMSSAPKGAMYAMIRVDCAALRDVCDDGEFCQQLLQAQNLVILPGKVFGMDGFVRVITCQRDQSALREAFVRMGDFCADRRRAAAGEDGGVVGKG